MAKLIENILQIYKQWIEIERDDEQVTDKQKFLEVQQKIYKGAKCFYVAQAFLEIKKFKEAVSLFFYIEKQISSVEKILEDKSIKIPKEDIDFMEQITKSIKADKCRA